MDDRADVAALECARNEAIEDRDFYRKLYETLAEESGAGVRRPWPFTEWTQDQRWTPEDCQRFGDYLTALKGRSEWAMRGRPYGVLSVAEAESLLTTLAVRIVERDAARSQVNRLTVVAIADRRTTLDALGEVARLRRKAGEVPVVNGIDPV